MAVSVAKIYIRSIVGIAATSAAIVVYGVYVAAVSEPVLLGWLTGCTAMVLFDKPQITEDPNPAPQVTDRRQRDPRSGLIAVK